jgi:hypothetical protein
MEDAAWNEELAKAKARETAVHNNAFQQQWANNAMKVASLPPFPVAGDPTNAATRGGSPASVKTSSIAEEVITEGHRIPGMSAIVAGIDDVAQVARRALTSHFDEHKQQKRKVSFVLPMGAKNAIRSAAEWGAAGAVTGALTAKPGKRMQGAAKGALVGGAGGAAAPMAGQFAGKLMKMKAAGSTPYDDTPLMDMTQRAADKYPEKVGPIQAIKSDFHRAIEFLKSKVDALRQQRLDVSQPQDKIAIDMKSVLQHVVPKQVMTPEGLGVMIGGGLLGGGAAYMASRGKKEHGGRSQAEVDLSRMKSSLPEKPEGIGGAVKKNVVNLHGDVAEQMRKHPVAATLAGASGGALIASRLAALAGLGSHLKK